MKKMPLTIILYFTAFTVNAQFDSDSSSFSPSGDDEFPAFSTEFNYGDDWGDATYYSSGEDTITPDSVDESSYLDELVISNNEGSNYLFKKNNEQLFWDSYAERFKLENSDINSITNIPNAVKTKSKFKGPMKFNSQNIVFYSLDFPKITNTLLQELESFIELKWQNVFKMKLLNSGLLVIDRPKLKQDYLTDSVGKYYYLPTGFDPSDPDSYEVHYFRYCTMKPYELFIQMKNNKPYIEFKFNDNSLKSIYMDPMELPQDCVNIKFLMGSRYFNKYLSENLSELPTQSLKTLISNYFNKESFVGDIPFTASDFRWIYILDDHKRRLSPPMDLDEFQYNASYLEDVIVSIEGGEETEDSWGGPGWGIERVGELTNAPNGRIKSVSIIQELNIQKNRGNIQTIGLLFNNYSAVMFDDSIEEFSKSDKEFLMHLYKMSYGLR